MTVIGSATPVRTAAGAVRSSAPVKAGFAIGVTALAGAAFLGFRELTGDHEPVAVRGGNELGSAPTTMPRASIEGPASTGTTPSAHYLQLTKTGPRPADAATDPAAFQKLLRADGPGWAAADGTISIPLPDGRSLWLFGDTLLNLPSADGSLRRNADFVRNSAILMDGNTATTLTTGSTADAGDFLEPIQSNQWYWPGHGIAEGNELVVFMSRMRETAEGEPGWNFESVGSDMVRLDLRDLSVKERVAMPGGKGTDWGAAVIKGGDGHTYVYGFRGDKGNHFRREAIVARTKTGHLKDGQFEYWNGKRWTDDASKASAVADGVSNSYSVVRTPEGRFAMVSQELFFETGLQVRTADSPQGPWSRWREIDAGPKKAPELISYNAQVHPTFTADGKLLASWNMNRRDAQVPGPNELDGYRPVFRAVDVGLLDTRR